MEFLGPLGGGGRADPQHVDQRPARVANRLEDLFRAAPAVVLDDDAGAWREVGLDPGVDVPRVAGDDVDAGVVEPPRERPVLDDELDLEAGQQDLVEHPDDQLVLADG